MIPSIIKWFPIVSGANEGVDPHTAPAGILERLENAAWTKDGRLDKRAGTRKLGTTGKPSSAKRLLTRSGELCQTDGTNLYSYSSSTSTWTSVGKVPETLLLWKSLNDPIDGVKSSDIASLGQNALLHAWVTGDPTSVGAKGSVFYEVVDITTGARTAPPTIIRNGSTLSSGWYARIVKDATSDSWVILWSDGANIKAFDGTTMSTLNTDGRAAGTTHFDAVDLGNGTFLIAYASGAGGIQLRAWTYALSNSYSGTVTGEAHAGFDCISLALYSNTILWIGYAWSFDGTNARAKVATANPANFTQILAPTVIDSAGGSNGFENIGMISIDATHIVYVYTKENSQTNFIDTLSYVVSTGGTATINRRSINVRLQSRPFIINSRVYALCADGAGSTVWGYTHDATTSKAPLPGFNAYLVEIETATTADNIPHRYVGMFNPLTAGMWTQNMLNSVFVSGTEAISVYPVLHEAPQIGRSFNQGTQLCDVSVGLTQTLFDTSNQPIDLWGAVEAGGEAYMAASVFTAYDGRRPFDFGFPNAFPLYGVTAATSGGHIVAGTYEYAYVPELHSAAGVVHRGPAAPPVPETVGGTTVSKFTLKIVPQSLAWKGTSATEGVPARESLRVELGLYRTQVGGSDLHRLTIDPTYNTLFNDPTAGPNTFDDTRADASIEDGAISGAETPLASRPLIYTSGELEDFPPPAAITVHTHKNRLWTLDGGRRTAWVSKDFTANQGVAPGFHQDNILIFDEDLVGIGTLDDKTVFFSQNSIWYVVGDGPAPNGDGSDYAPTRVQTDVGCINPRSIVSEPDGLMFMSARGLYRLKRNLELEWVGKPVRDTLASFPIVTSAVLVHSLNHVRFTCNNSNGTAGRVLSYDHVRGQWSVFRYTDNGTADVAIADSILLNGVWHFVTTAGVVYREDTSTYLDGAGDSNDWVAMDVETSEIYGENGPLAYERVRRFSILAQQITDCDLTIRTAINGGTDYSQTRSWTSAELAMILEANVGIHIKNQKPESIRFRVTDAAPTGVNHTTKGTGQGINLSAMGIEIATKKGLEKRSQDARK